MPVMVMVMVVTGVALAVVMLVVFVFVLVMLVVLVFVCHKRCLLAGFAPQSYGKAFATRLQCGQGWGSSPHFATELQNSAAFTIFALS